jgi:1,4-dihydroxy-2-naphthoyl-CoA hydrolase
MSNLTEPRVPLDRTLDGTLGFKVDELEIGRITGHFEITDAHKQPYGIVHGGVHAAFAESLASIGTYRAVAADGKAAMGQSNNTSFLRSMTEGTAHGEAIAIHKGRTTWIWDVTIRDEEQRIVAVSRMTIAVREIR